MRKLFLLLGALAFVGCGGGEETTGVAPAPSTEPAAAPIDPATVGTITGKVNLEGTAPEQTVIQMGADPYCARMHQSASKTEFVVVNEDGTLRNVFVYVKQGLEGRKFTAPTDPVVLDQKGCTYHPHVFGIMVGQPLEVVNNDETLHNIHAMPTKNKPFNIGQPVQGLRTKRSFEVPEVMVPFKCDVHKWMNCYAGVLDHPYYSVTGDGGTFEISNLPPGNYVIEAWHEKFGVKTQDVALGEKETKEIGFTYTASE